MDSFEGCRLWTALNRIEEVTGSNPLKTHAKFLVLYCWCSYDGSDCWVGGGGEGGYTVGWLYSLLLLLLLLFVVVYVLYMYMYLR